jgi:hypothetical protein
MRVSGQVFDPTNIAMLLEVDVIEIFDCRIKEFDRASNVDLRRAR